jgi:hypothetical protein
VRLLLAAQVADGHRHIESVLRLYAEVFGVEGGIEAVNVSRARSGRIASPVFQRLRLEPK